MKKTVFFLLFTIINIGLAHSQVDKVIKNQMLDLIVPKDTIPFRVAQFGCPHSDKDMRAIHNPEHRWNRRKPFARGVQATVTAGKICDVYHVLGDWSGQQTVHEGDLKKLTDAIADDIYSAKTIFRNNSSKEFNVKSIAGNHVSQFSSDNIAESYLVYENAVQKSLDLFNQNRLEEVRDTSIHFDYPWESYYYIEGNNLFFFLSDRNDVDAPWGKKNSLDDKGEPITGGHPAGAIRKSSLAFFLDVAIKHSDKNVFLHTHQGLPNTVVGTSTKINGWRGHNDMPDESKKYKGTIGALLSPEMVQDGRMRIEENDTIFQVLFNQWDKLVVGCANTHTHAPINYAADPFFTGENLDEARTVNNDHYGKINKTFIMNIGNLTKYHGHNSIIKRGMHPHGSIWEFNPGSDTLIAQKIMVEGKRIFKTNDVLEAGDFHQPSEKKYLLKYTYDPTPNIGIPVKPNSVSNPQIVENEDEYILSFEGDADAYAIVSSNKKIKFNPVSFGEESAFGETYLPTYKVSDSACPKCEVLRFQGTHKEVKLPKKFDVVSWKDKVNQISEELTHNKFVIYAINGGGGKVIYSDGVEVELK